MKPAQVLSLMVKDTVVVRSKSMPSAKRGVKA